MVKSITAREVFKQVPEVKMQLWGGEFWTDGYYVSTVGKVGSGEQFAKAANFIDKEFHPKGMPKNPGLRRIKKSISAFAKVKFVILFYENIFGVL